MIKITAKDKADVRDRAAHIARDPAMLLPFEAIVEVMHNTALYSELDLDLATRIYLAEEIIKETARIMGVKITYPEPAEESLREWSERLLKQIKLFPEYPTKPSDIKRPPV